MAGQTDLPRANWFGEFEEHVTFHVIDSIRPLSLDNLFMSDRIFVWDDGGAKNVEDELKESWEIVTVCFHIPWVLALNQLNYQRNPRPPDDGESSDEDLEGEERSDDDLSQEDEDPLSDRGTPSNKRRKPEAHAARKRRRMGNGVRLFHRICVLGLTRIQRIRQCLVMSMIFTVQSLTSIIRLEHGTEKALQMQFMYWLPYLNVSIMISYGKTYHQWKNTAPIASLAGSLY